MHSPAITSFLSIDQYHYYRALAGLTDDEPEGTPQQVEYEPEVPSLGQANRSQIDQVRPPSLM